MCTFKISNFNDELPIDRFLKLGGPTLSNSFSFNGVTFTHHLLSITGKVTPQPIVQNDILYMLLGEVYNYDSVLFKSDIYTVIEQYKLHKDNFTKYLDGEFIIIIYDMRTGLINFYTDPWATKMAWFDKSNNNFYFGSFKLSDSSIRLLPNSHYIFDIKNNSLSQINDSLHTWELNQYKNNYDDIIHKYNVYNLFIISFLSSILIIEGVSICKICVCILLEIISILSMFIRGCPGIIAYVNLHFGKLYFL